VEAQIGRKPRPGGPRGGERGPSRITWLGGLHAVEETLRAKPQSVRQLLVEHESKQPGLGELVRRAKQAGAKVIFAGRRELDRLAGHHHQGVAVQVVGLGGSEMPDLGDFLSELTDEAKKNMVLVALDQIQDPHNLGAIARSAVNLGAAALIFPERRSAPVTPVVVQASAGAIQKIPLLSVVNLGQALEKCKEAGFWVYGADMGGAPVWSATINFPLVLVIGSEGAGMRPLVKETCDEVLSIPQAGQAVESLNASCAASVLLYELARRKSVEGR